MRRLLLILLLCMLPLQSSWAVVCAYCPDRCAVESDTPVVAQQVADDATALDADGDCGVCHMGGVGLAGSPAEPGATASLAAPVGTHAHTFVTSVRPDRPERPKWARAA